MQSVSELEHSGTAVRSSDPSVFQATPHHLHLALSLPRSDRREPHKPSKAEKTPPKNAPLYAVSSLSHGPDVNILIRQTVPILVHDEVAIRKSYEQYLSS